MKKVILLVGSIIISLAFTANVFAVNNDCGRGRGAWEMENCRDGRGMPTIWAKLNLTDEQTARIKTLREAYLKDIKPLQDKMFSKRGDLKLLWLQTSPDKEKILAVQREIRELRDMMQEKATGNLVDTFNVLTPEQQAKVQTTVSGMKGRGMMAPGNGPGQGSMHPGMMGH